MNPKTGEVLALLSSPYVDPNKLDEFWSDYAADPRSPFVNRATRGQYPPGSAVKPFVLAAALADRITFPEERWQDSGRVVLSGRTISNFQSQGWGSLTSLEALANSSNVVFAQLAAKLGPRLLDTLRQCGLGEALPFPLGSAAANSARGAVSLRMGADRHWAGQPLGYPCRWQPQCPRSPTEGSSCGLT